MEERAFILENVFVQQVLRGINVKLANVISHVEMEVNVPVKINASAPRATKEIFVQSLSVNLFVDYMAPVLNPIHASVKKAGMEGTAINGMEPTFWTPWGQQAPSTDSTHLRRNGLKRGKRLLNPIISGELQTSETFYVTQSS